MAKVVLIYSLSISQVKDLNCGDSLSIGCLSSACITDVMIEALDEILFVREDGGDVE